MKYIIWWKWERLCTRHQEASAVPPKAFFVTSPGASRSLQRPKDPKVYGAVCGLSSSHGDRWIWGPSFDVTCTLDFDSFIGLEIQYQYCARALEHVGTISEDFVSVRVSSLCFCHPASSLAGHWFDATLPTWVSAASTNPSRTRMTTLQHGKSLFSWKLVAPLAKRRLDFCLLSGKLHRPTLEASEFVLRNVRNAS